MTHWNPENESTLEKYNGNWKMKHTMKNTNCNWKNAIETGKLKNWTWRYNGNIEGEKRNTRRRIQTATEKNAIETGKLKNRTWRYNGNIEEYNGNWTETLKKTMKPRKKSHWELKIENWKCFFGCMGFLCIFLWKYLMPFSLRMKILTSFLVWHGLPLACCSMLPKRKGGMQQSNAKRNVELCHQQPIMCASERITAI